jgi:hypothetical protein
VIAGTAYSLVVNRDASFLVPIRMLTTFISFNRAYSGGAYCDGVHAVAWVNSA